MEMKDLIKLSELIETVTEIEESAMFGAFICTCVDGWCSKHGENPKSYSKMLCDLIAQTNDELGDIYERG